MQLSISRYTLVEDSVCLHVVSLLSYSLGGQPPKTPPPGLRPWTPSPLIFSDSSLSTLYCYSSMCSCPIAHLNGLSEERISLCHSISLSPCCQCFYLILWGRDAHVQRLLFCLRSQRVVNMIKMQVRISYPNYPFESSRNSKQYWRYGSSKSGVLSAPLCRHSTVKKKAFQSSVPQT